MPDDVLELRRWADAVESLIRAAPLRLVSRVIVFAETGSTQDAALLCGGREPGLLVLAGRQSAGRGRLGRAWESADGLGVAATFTLAVPREQHAAVALGAGVAVAEAIEQALGPSRSGSIGLRWPNDAVERSSGKKVAGVLIETKSESSSGGPLLLVGVGVNVLQAEADFPPELQGSASSLRLMGAGATRLDLILRLAERLDAAVSAALAGEATRLELLERWKRRDVLTGRPGAFVHDGRSYEGIVLEILPDLSLRLRMGEGSTIDLPAAGTSMLHEGAGKGRRKNSTARRSSGR